MAKEVKHLDRQDTNSLKWDGYESVFHRDDLLPLWVADMDFEVAPAIKKALKKRQSHAIYGYPVVDDGFYQAIIHWHKSRFCAKVSREEIAPLNGVVSAIFAALQAFSDNGDRVALLSPVYGPFFTVPTALERVVVEIALGVDEGGFFIDFDRFEAEISKHKPKVLIFCHPHNPIGKVWSKDDLARTADICAKHNCLIISDEIHADIIYEDKKHTPFYEIVSSNLISLFAPTKSFNLPGLNIAYAIIKDKNLKAKFEKTAHAMHITLPNTFGIEALKAAYFDGEKWLESLLLKLDKNRAIVDMFFANKSYARFYLPEATYLGWIDFAPSGLDTKTIRSKLLDEAKVGLSGGDFFFGGRATAFHRINFATDTRTIKTALKKIDSAFTNKT